jgi:hypothetical protein
MTQIVETWTMPGTMVALDRTTGNLRIWSLRETALATVDKGFSKMPRPTRSCTSERHRQECNCLSGFIRSRKSAVPSPEARCFGGNRTSREGSICVDGSIANLPRKLSRACPSGGTLNSLSLRSQTMTRENSSDNLRSGLRPSRLFPANANRVFRAKYAYSTLNKTNFRKEYNPAVKSDFECAKDPKC